MNKLLRIYNKKPRFLTIPHYIVIQREGGIYLKYLFLAILGAVIGWIGLSFILEDWDQQGLMIMIIGIVIGYNTRKQTEDKFCFKRNSFLFNYHGRT